MDIDKPIILIDLSSFIFYRFFAIQKWLSISGKEKEFTQEMIIDKFSTLFESNLRQIKKKLNVDWKNIVLVRDCPRNKIWRVEVFPDYKKGRDSKRSAAFDPLVFSHAYTDVVPRMIKSYGLQLIHYERAEADDVIAVITNEIRKQKPKTKIFIMSLDSDFLQLHGPNTEIIDFQFKNLRKKMTDEELDHYLLWKIIRGDASDNIPPIDKKIGDITAKKLAMNPDALRQKVDSSTAISESFERNNILINFLNIPESMKEGIIETMKTIM